MKKINTTALICIKDNYGILYKISKIEYNEYENGEFEYIFTPFYNVIDLIPDSIFQGIPGLDLSLRKEQYFRKNIIPVFISERTPSENREDVRILLEENNMESLNRLEWLIRTKTKYSGDNLQVIEYKNNEIIKYKKNSIYDLVKRSDNIVKELLSIICAGDYFYSDDIIIDDSTRSLYYRLLIQIYSKEYDLRKKAQKIGIENAKKNGTYKGRKKKKIDTLLLEKTLNDYKDKKISLEFAIKQLEISKATFFRRLKEEKNNII